ncbi:hypothetical protein ABPG77_001138 [Micractinium sp. CCAP 211/92]
MDLSPLEPRGNPLPLLHEPWLRARERVRCEIFQESEDISKVVAGEIAGLIRLKQAKGRRCVLGLATGSTPMHIYRELVRMHREEGLSFRNVQTFNLDEYLGVPPDSLQSYRRFMREHLSDHVDLPPGAARIPDGTVPLAEVPRHCAEYEKAIEEAGGIDLQLLGLGRTGHIGFNERGSSRGSTTRLITLDRVTRADAAADFFGERNVPRQAITMGVATILKTRRVILIAFGENKAGVAAQAVEGPVTPGVAASYLQEHPDATVYLDYAAAAGLTRVRCPWVLGPILWDETQVKKAATWLAQKVQKPLLKLTDDDYNENSLQDLLAERGPAYEIGLHVFYGLQRTITGWPGGKPSGAQPSEAVAVPFKQQGRAMGGASGDTKGDGQTTALPATRPQRAAAEMGPNTGSSGKQEGMTLPVRAAGVPCCKAAPAVQLRWQYTDHADAQALLPAPVPARTPGASSAFPKRILVLSPHPDDDVISMGGTLIRLIDQGHEVHVAYQTSGNIAVWDEDALRFADFAVQFGAAMGLGTADRAAEVAARIESFLRCKKPGEASWRVDSPEVQRIKTLIRYTEARSAWRTCGGDPSNTHFLDMPFYQTGRVVKAPLSTADVGLIVDLLERLRPHQVYAAGDLSDLHATHRTCLQAIFQALEAVRQRAWYRECGTTVLLYRGAWQEWEPYEVDLAVPLGPAELQQKIDAIWKHQSQKDRALFPGADPREFWQRAQDRNRATAELYDRLGLAEYEAMEAFVIYDPEHPARLFKAPLPSGEGAAVALKSSALADQPGCSEQQ